MLLFCSCLYFKIATFIFPCESKSFERCERCNCYECCSLSSICCWFVLQRCDLPLVLHLKGEFWYFNTWYRCFLSYTVCRCNFAEVWMFWYWAVLFVKMSLM